MPITRRSERSGQRSDTCMTPLETSSAACGRNQVEDTPCRALSAVSFQPSACGVTFITSPRNAEKLQMKNLFSVKAPPVKIPAKGNTNLYDGARFFIFEEKLPVGGYRERHSHNQRLVININQTTLEQKVDGQDKPVIRDIVPDD